MIENESPTELITNLLSQHEEGLTSKEIRTQLSKYLEPKQISNRLFQMRKDSGTVELVDDGREKRYVLIKAPSSSVSVKPGEPADDTQVEESLEQTAAKESTSVTEPPAEQQKPAIKTGKVTGVKYCDNCYQLPQNCMCEQLEKMESQNNDSTSAVAETSSESTEQPKTIETIIAEVMPLNCSRALDELEEVLQRPPAREIANLDLKINVLTRLNTMLPPDIGAVLREIQNDLTVEVER